MKNKNKKNMIISIVIIVVILGIYAWNIIPKGEKQIARVDVVKAKKGDVVSTLSASGNVASEVNVDYISPINASIENVNVVVGQSVKVGDFLLSYDTKDLQSEYDLATLRDKSEQATADDSINVSNANAQKVADVDAKINSLNSQIDAKKAEIQSLNSELSKPEIAGNEQLMMNKKSQLEQKTEELTDLQQQLEIAKSEKDAASAGVLSDQQKQSIDYNRQVSKLSVTGIENDLSVAKAGLVSECDGIVTNITVTNGSMATEGQTLVTIAKISDMKVDFTISKYNLSDVKEGQEAIIKVLDNDYVGKIKRISKVAVNSGDDLSGVRSVSGSSAMVAAEMHIENPDEKLIIGIDADMDIKTGEVKDVVVIPSSAVNEDVDGTFVYILKNGKVASKKVKIGLMSDDHAEVISGIKSGDMVLSNIDSSIEEGMEAEANEIKETTSETNAVESDNAQ